MTAQEVYSIGQVDPCNSGMWCWHNKSVGLLEFTPTGPSVPSLSRVAMSIGLSVCWFLCLSVCAVLENPLLEVVETFGQRLRFKYWYGMTKWKEKKCGHNFVPNIVKMVGFEQPPQQKSLIIFYLRSKLVETSGQRMCSYFCSVRTYFFFLKEVPRLLKFAVL